MRDRPFHERFECIVVAPTRSLDQVSLLHRRSQPDSSHLSLLASDRHDPFRPVANALGPHGASSIHPEKSTSSAPGT